MVTIDKEKCTNCGACYDVCPALVIEEAGGKAHPAHPRSCIKCWHCVAVCPVGAVQCDEFPLSDFEAKSGMKPLATPAALRNLMAVRRSVREFKDEPVPRELLEELAAAAAHAPTGHNDQGVRLSIITDRRLIERTDARIMKVFLRIVTAATNPLAGAAMKAVGEREFAEMLLDQKDALERFRAAEKPEKRMHVFRGAPVLVVAHHDIEALTGKDDCVIALAQMQLMAEAHGLGCTWIGYLVAAALIDPSLKKSLGVPLMNNLAAAAILGWPRRKYKRIIPRKPLPVKWIG